MICCYHHTDLDGMSAAYVVHKDKPFMIEDHPEGYHATNYGDNFDKHTSKDDVFIVDVSISEGDYEKFMQVCKTARSVTWVDHHATSLETIKNHLDELQSTTNLTYFVSTCACGAALAYAYLHIPQDKLMPIRAVGSDEHYSIDAEYVKGSIKIIAGKRNKKNPSEYKWFEHTVHLPRWLYHVDDFDCWKKLDNQTDYFKCGIDAHDISFIQTDDNGNKSYNILFDKLFFQPNFVGDLINDGRKIYKHIMTTWDNQLSGCFTYEIDGTTFLCKNGWTNSWEFRDKIEQYPAVILFNYNGKSGKWEYSVYSHDKSDFDCSKFCAKYGGGGHLHASGFSTDHLIFTSPVHTVEKKTDPVIFLGGTVNAEGHDWRAEFKKVWDRTYIGDEKITLFDPVVPNWTPKERLNEQKVKSTARMNLFVITPEQTGAYSFIEAMESALAMPGVTMIVSYTNHYELSEKNIKLYDEGVYLCERRGCTTGKYDNMQALVNDVIDILSKPSKS